VVTAGFHVELEHVALAFGERRVFEDLSCGFPRGRVSALLGGSGMGKSTVLRLIGGLVRADRGIVRVDDVDVGRLEGAELAHMRRRIGMTFQAGALFDSMTVFENAALPLREHTDLSEAEISERVRGRLADVGLPDAGDLLPGQLSGGMVKRAALARAVIMEPEILLCDEPFSDLDPLNVRRIEALLMDLNERLGLTIIMATHHLDTAFSMAAWMVLLGDRETVSGPPKDLARDVTPRVVEFLGAASPGRTAGAHP
jgi:phospholipid/cholesterol/gamma-HCH transport system ATP-binding protein